MPSPSTQTGSTIIPSMRYRDAPAAIEWLCTVFGFAKHAVYPNADGTIAHAELTLGSGMIMLGSINDNEYGRMIKQPDEIGGYETQSLYVVVPDADEIERRARAAGATIVMSTHDASYGGRHFACRDLEGRLWSFGTYDPWPPYVAPAK